MISMSDDSAGYFGADLFRSLFSFRRVPNTKQWRRPSIEYNKQHDYFLAVVEFDDQGWYQDVDQRESLEQFLDQKVKQREDLLIIVFIHGWKHNAAAHDTSLKSFCSVLQDARRSENYRNRRHILGVYLSWRGLSLSGNRVWMNASFWTRKKAATKVAVGSAREILARLRAFQTIRNKSNHIEEPDVGTRLIVAGHSFGGLILFTAVSEYLIESVTSSSLLGGGKKLKQIVRPFGDLVILINPAFEAARYLPLYIAMQGTEYSENQRPCFLAVTASNDHATGRWFRIGRWLSTRLESVRQHALPSCRSDNAERPPADAEKQAILNTIGHLPWLITHRLSCVKTEESAHQPYKGKGRDRPDWPDLAQRATGLR